MPDHSTIDAELRAQLRTLTIAPDDALADEMSARAAAHRRRSVLPLTAAAAVVTLAAAVTALTASMHGAAPSVPTRTVTPAGGPTSPTPTSPGPLVLRLHCVASDGQVSEPLVTMTPGEGGSADPGNFARIYLPRADGSICTELSE